MKKLFLLLTIALAFHMHGQVQKAPTFETYITVDTAVVPDKIIMELRLNEIDMRSRENLQNKEAQMLDALKELGIDPASQLTVTEIGSNLKEVLFGKDDVVKRKKYALVVHDAQSAGDVIIALEQANIANVRIVSTEVTQVEDLELVLIDRAMKKAFDQLEAANRYTGMEYDRVRQIRIDQNRMNYLSAKVAGVRSEARTLNESATEIAWSPKELGFEKQTVTLKVAVILELRPMK